MEQRAGRQAGGAGRKGEIPLFAHSIEVPDGHRHDKAERYGRCACDPRGCGDRAAELSGLKVGIFFHAAGGGPRPGGGCR